MSMPAEISTNLAFSWQEPTEPIAPLGSNVYSTSPDFGLDYLLPHNLSVQPFPAPNAFDPNVLDHLQNMTRPYATNWSLFDNCPAGMDRDTMNENSEPGHRVRMNSMASSASSLSFNLPDSKKNCPIGSLPEASEAYVGYNLSYQTSPQSSYESTYSSNYDDRMSLQPNPILSDQPHPIDLASSCSFNGFPEIYLPNFPRNFRPKATSYCMNRPYKCEKCGSSFSRNHDLKRHSRIHLDVKPFPCTCCDKAFARKDALKRHLLVKGCSQGKQSSPPRGSSQNERQQKPGQSTISTPGKKNTFEQSRSLRSSSATRKNSPQEPRISSGNHSLRSSNNDQNGLFGEIKLQNIKCTMPNFF